jgi:integration host factor subunit alpha
VTKEDIVNRIWNQVNLNKKESAHVVETIISSVKDVLARGDKLKIGGFGVFEVKDRKARMGRNPKTGEEAEIKAGKTIKFKPGKPLKQEVMGL